MAATEVKSRDNGNGTPTSSGLVARLKQYRTALLISVLAVLLPLAWTHLRAFVFGDSDGHDDSQEWTLHARPRLPRRDQVMRPLEWGDVQFLHTTDIHGHLAPHHSPLPPATSFSADWADWVAFIDLMRTKAHSQGKDLVVVDSGDLVTGNGLSDTTDPVGNFSNGLIAEASYDVLTMGNHDCSDLGRLQSYRRGFLPLWGDRYLTSNVEVKSTDGTSTEAVGKRWTSFVLPQTGARVTALGVLFDFAPPYQELLITPPSQLVHEDWLKALVASEEGQSTDIWLLAGHMPADGAPEDEWDALVAGLRSLVGADKPIVGLGGHTHVRACRRTNENSMVLQSGRFHETAGWVSLNLSSSGTVARSTFSRSYIDLNPSNMAYHLGQELTPKLFAGSTKAKRVRSRLQRFLAEKGLNVVHGFAPRDYYLERFPAHDERSILNASTSVLEKTFSDGETARLVILNSGSLRSDLRRGPLTTNDQFILSPFSDAFYVLKGVKRSAALASLAQMIEEAPPPAPVPAQTSKGADGRFHSQGYVTVDLCGTAGAVSEEGDDTVHSSAGIVPFEPPYLSALMGRQDTDLVDVIILRYLLPRFVDALNRQPQERKWSTEDASIYHDSLGQRIKTRDLWKHHAHRNWNGNGGRSERMDAGHWRRKWASMQREAALAGHDVYEVDAV